MACEADPLPITFNKFNLSVFRIVFAEFHKPWLFGTHSPLVYVDL